MNVTLEEAKAYLKISSPNQDDELTPIVTGVNSFIDSMVALLESGPGAGMTEIYFGHTQGTETYQALNLSRFMRTGNVPTLVVTRTYFDKGSGTFGQEEATEYSVTPAAITISSSAPTGEYGVTIQAGLNPTQEANKTLAALEMIKYYYKQEYKQTQSSGGQTVTSTPFTGTLPKHIRSLLDTFREL